LFEAEMNSVERLAYYCFELPQEKLLVLPSDKAFMDWPSKGSIKIENLEIRYPNRPDHAVISNLSLEIQGGERIGICGRTGSGKSTLATTFFRMMEPSQGRILIDGVDISQLGLQKLRRGIQMIPQDPVLFEGSIRSNLELFETYTDQELWRALSLIGLDGHFKGQPGQLEAPVSQKGENLSLGQRQLICLCRAILSKPKILVLDEATASIDPASDQIIQKAIHECFPGTTIISIAHRLDTIADFDKVLVLDQGSILECGSPATLLQNHDSHFYKLKFQKI
jgi:ABC-type multidrug transport system fused ATPase/permease subunit